MRKSQGAKGLNKYQLLGVLQSLLWLKNQLCDVCVHVCACMCMYVCVCMCVCVCVCVCVYTGCRVRTVPVGSQGLDLTLRL